MINYICELCGKPCECPPLSKEDILNGEKLPDVCQDCPSIMPELFGKGLRAGDYDISFENEIFRLSICENTTWEEIFKILPKDSPIKKLIRVR